MLEKVPSGASPDDNQNAQLAGATPGGPSPIAHSPAKTIQNATDLTHQYTLQFLIAAIKTTSK